MNRMCEQQNDPLVFICVSLLLVCAMVWELS